MVTLGAGHLGTAKTTGTHDLNTLNLWLTHCRLDSLAHCATESHAVGQLLGDGLCHQLSVGINVLDLEDVEGNLPTGELFELLTDCLLYTSRCV